MSIKTKLAYWLLERKKANASRHVRITNLQTARTVGIIWSMEERNAFYTIQKSLKNLPIQIKSLHFASSSATESVQGESFSRKNLSWLGLPKSAFIYEFIGQEFDILIDLTVEKKFALHAIALLSRAHFKVGYSNGLENIYELNIDIQNKPDADFLVEQILNYLTLINR